CATGLESPVVWWYKSLDVW
nr:immunoglobulin heavy chain junction region [Macaca mulatta]MOW18909.1 immunoglobulin heavy chain junction region [Macaca mulatta]MOW18964.1 immunoglobulin heavy chain junction region [Macaca mulatta]MOW19018.1 immunoglobulin heavy chain junction region [Macaca mulatta]MOW19033.1 immunoglobulin heavy chain junction region [Macaca mulatta]